jgi:hypothetical protein
MHSQCASLSTLRRDWRRPSDLPLRVQMHSMPAQSICWLAAISNRGVYQAALLTADNGVTFRLLLLETNPYLFRRRRLHASNSRFWKPHGSLRRFIESFAYR